MRYNGALCRLGAFASVRTVTLRSACLVHKLHTSKAWVLRQVPPILGPLECLPHPTRMRPQATFGERPPSSNKFRARSGAVHTRTFTSRPAVGCARRTQKLDFSHNPAQLERIENETRSLVTRLERVYGRDVGTTVRHSSPPRGLPCNEAPHSRNRCDPCRCGGFVHM